nr:MAG TPA: minor tail protein [Caudoviricetes sp.]
MALEERGRRITLKADISQLKSAFRKISAIVRENDRELRKLGKALKLDPHNIELLTEKQRVLQDQILRTSVSIFNLKEQMQKHVQLGEIKEFNQLKVEMESTRARLKGLKEDLKTTQSTLKNFSNITALAKLDKSLESSRSNVERLNKALKLDTTNVSNLAHKFLELQSQEDALVKKTHILIQDLKKIDFKVNPQGYQELKSKLEQAKVEAKQVRLELDKLGGAKFNPVIVQLEKLDNEIKKSRESSKLLQQALDFKPTSLTKSLHLEETRTQLEKTREKIKLMKSELSKLNTHESKEEFIKLSSKIVESEKHVKDLIHSVGILNAKKLDGIRGSFSAIGSSIEGNAQQIANFGRNFTFGYTLPVTYGAKKVIDSFRETDDTLRRVAAVSDGAVTDFAGTFTEMEGKIRQASHGTVYSINDVGRGVEDLIKAGLNSTQAMGAVGHAMNLARADGIDLARATEIITDGMNAMGIQFGKTEGEVKRNVGNFVDILNAAAVASTTDVGQMGEAMKYAGAIAGTLGFEMKDLGLALAIMANQGIKASTAGTSLRSGLTNLVKPSKAAAKAMYRIGFSATDAMGNMKPLSQIMAELREKTQGMTNAQKNAFSATVFGKTAMSGWSAILKATNKDVDNLRKAIDESTGSTERMANQMNSGVGGAIDKFKASLSNAAYETGKAWGPALKSVAESLTELLKSFNESSDGTKRFITGVLGVTAALGPLTWAIGGILSPFLKFKNLLSTFRTAKAAAEMGEVASKTGLLARTFAAVPPQMKLFLGAATLVGGGLLYLKNKYDPLMVAHRNAIESAEKVGEAFRKVGDEAKTFGDKIKQTSDVFENTFGTSNKFTEKLNYLVEETRDGFDKIREILNQAASDGREITKQEADAVAGNFENLVDSINKRVIAERQGYEQIVQIARNASANKAITDSAYESQFASHIGKLGQIHEESKQNTQKWYDDLVAINSQLPPQLQLSMDRINEIYQQALVRDRQNYSQSTQAAIQAYSERYQIESDFIPKLAEAKRGMEEVEKQHQQRMKENREIARGDIQLQRTMDEQEDKRYLEEKAWHYKELEGQFDAHKIKHVGQWLAAIQDNIQKGGELTASQASNVQAFLSTMNTLPEDTKRQITQGLKDAGIDIDVIGAALAAQMQKHGVTLNNQFASGLLSEKPSVDTAIQTTLNAVTDSVNRTSLFAQGQSVMLTGRDGLAAGKSAVDAATGNVMDGVKNKVQTTDMKPAGQQKSEELAQGIKSKDGDVWNAAQETANHGRDGAKSISFWQPGWEMAAGMAEGVYAGNGYLSGAVRTIVANALAAGRSEADSHSPSRKFRDFLGITMPQGIAVGIDKGADEVYSSMTTVMKGALQTAKDFNFRDKIDNVVDFTTAGNYAIQHSVSQNTSVIDTLNVLINKVNDLELRSDVYLDGDKIGNATYKRHEVIDRRLGLV